MPFDTPSLPQLISTALADLESSSSLRRSDAAVTARVQAGTAYGLYEYLRWQYAQQFPDTAEEADLLRHGRNRGVEPKPATQAHGLVLLVGSTGAAIPAGTPLQSAAGVRYTVTEGVVLSNAASEVVVLAEVAGALGNAAAGTPLDLVSPVLGVSSVATVGAAGITGGVDAEKLEAYRARVLERYGLQPHGGNADDYAAWAKAVPGVTRAWCKRRWVGPGTVAVFVVNDAADPITPPAPELERIRTEIAAQRPVTAELFVLAPTLVSVPYRLSVTPDTPRAREAVESALRALHARESNLGERLLKTHISEAISGATGEWDHELLSPLADVVPAPAELLVYGGVTWE